jgi:hypothetical protein
MINELRIAADADLEAVGRSSTEAEGPDLTEAK